MAITNINIYNLCQITHPNVHVHTYIRMKARMFLHIVLVNQK